MKRLLNLLGFRQFYRVRDLGRASDGTVKEFSWSHWSEIPEYGLQWIGWSEGWRPVDTRKSIGYIEYTGITEVKIQVQYAFVWFLRTRQYDTH